MCAGLFALLYGGGIAKKQEAFRSVSQRPRVIANENRTQLKREEVVACSWPAITQDSAVIAFKLKQVSQSTKSGESDSWDEPTMAFNLRLPALLAKMRWKVKIRDKERVEDPHVTIIHGTKTWRVCLRDGRFMDGGSWKDMGDGLQEFVRASWERLCKEWDRMYPHNPIQGEAIDNDGD